MVCTRLFLSPSHKSLGTRLIIDYDVIITDFQLPTTQDKNVANKFFFSHTGGVGSIGKVVSVKDWKNETVVSMRVIILYNIV